MRGRDPALAGIETLHRGYAGGSLDPVEVTLEHLQRIMATDGELRTFITVARERALGDAERSRERWRRGAPLGPLDGVPIALKDNIDVAGLPCTAGTAAYRHRVPDSDAVVQQRLAGAGAVVLGKLNMHEGALGATTDNPVYGRCINPLRAGFTPGGSSGGSGAAVAAGLCVAALGTDTMGSVRVPAAYCGVFGYKPSTGAVPMDGIVPLSRSLDTVGPLARSAADTAALAAALLWPGHRGAVEPEPAAGRRWGQLRVGVPRQLAGMPLAPAVLDAHQAFLARLSAAGARLLEVDIAQWDPGRSRRAGLLVSEAEGAEYWHSMLGPALDGLSPQFAAMLRYPARAGAEKLAQARATLAAIRAAGERVFAEVDLLALPTTAQRSFAHTDMPPVDQADCTALANFTGGPSIAIPVAPTAAAEELPASVQLMAAPGADRLLLGLASAIDLLQR
ncbi:MAG: amidase [Burkholderiales bacterium]|nr:MAG: amidase [Burkholderiales bacterium]